MGRKDRLENIKANLLIKLLKMGKIGGSHTSFDNLPKGFPSHERKDVKKVAEDLINDNIIDSHPTGYGQEVSINPEKVEEIMNWPKIRDLCGNDPYLLQKYQKK